MNKLLSANLTRLRKSKLFWGLLILMFALGLYMVFMLTQQLGTKSLDMIFFNFTFMIGLAAAIFSSFFLGAEYSDGTIRNKLVVGHLRTDIYFANLITNIAAAFCMNLAYLAAVIVVGTPLFGFVRADAWAVFMMLFGASVMTVAFCSVLTMISMACSNKAAAAVVSILGIFLLLYAAIYIQARLAAPEAWPGYEYSVDGQVVSTPETMIPNPQYLRGTKRAVYEFFYDFLPTGQAIQYSDMTAVHLWQMPLYSLLISIAVTAVGTILFKRKDLK